MAITINGNNAATAGGIGYGDGTNLVFTTAGTSGQILTSAGSGAPTWSSTVPTVNLTTGVTGTLPIANGGTNTTATPTAGAVPYGTGTALAYTAAGSAGGVLYSAGSGAPAFSAAGTSGQVLTSAGSGAPTWTTPSAGAMTLIATRTASSSASLEWTGLSGYNNYLIIFDNVRLSASGAFVGIQFGTGSGPTYVTSNYYNSGMYAYSNVSVTPARNNAVFGLLPQLDSGYDTGDANQGFTGPVHIMSMIDGNLAQMSAIVRYFSSGTTNYNTNVATGFLFANTTVKTAIRVIPNSGTLSSGSVSLYGISS